VPQWPVNVRVYPGFQTMKCEATIPFE